ncbi:hypothetical protein BU23DRAFT_565596 [Bimuria novae-zelandiae CBS 107.79]|uniref:Uncharacterized protein n=1 Tax=Bimuria novae-zelandiae CBS 107.79 TaxID=1447943 RepID=A0A6A5VJR5_9PLEO|nr:hypothetical protein BU23DRAFT_565596 [Bimuria novae-zelandiae CBS 107.79]
MLVILEQTTNEQRIEVNPTKQYQLVGTVDPRDLEPANDVANLTEEFQVLRINPLNQGVNVSGVYGMYGHVPPAPASTYQNHSFSRELEAPRPEVGGRTGYYDSFGGREPIESSARSGDRLSYRNSMPPSPRPRYDDGWNDRGRGYGQRFQSNVPVRNVL